MRFAETAFRALLAAAAADIVLGNCNADNCLRALRATNTPSRLEHAQSFCASFTAATAAVTQVQIPTYAADDCTSSQNGDMAMRLSSACSCLPSTTTTTVPSMEPCAEMSSSWAAALPTQPTPRVDAALAYACMNSVPLNKGQAIQLVDDFKPYLDWISTTPYLAEPPEDYFFAPHDVFASLEKVKENLLANKYKSEYEFQADLVENVFIPNHDGHTTYKADVLNSVSSFERDFSIVSVSADGNSLPEIKLRDDVLSSPQTASTIKLINGVKASDYLLEQAIKYETHQDIDTCYNNLFFEKARFAQGSPGNFQRGGVGSVLYKGPRTELTFENGTVVSRNNLAAITGNLTGVADGKSFYNKFCQLKESWFGDPETSPGKRQATNEDALPGYPKPIIRTKEDVVSGYFLDDEGYGDVAIISLLLFQNFNPPEYQRVVEEFLTRARAAGKTKLIVDLQGNRGGNVIQGYDFGRQLFPQLMEEDLDRWRTTKGFLDIARVISDRVAGVDLATCPDQNIILDALSPYNYRADVNLTNQAFLTFEDQYSPHVYRDTVYSAIARFNLSNPLITTNATFGVGFEVTGYGSRANVTQPFAAEDIVIVYDGYCGSTCTVVAAILQRQAGVRAVAFGGRPQGGPIQGIGGTKGGGPFPIDYIWSSMQHAAYLTDDRDKHAEFARYKKLPFQRALGSSLNTRNQIYRSHLDDEDNLPAQFVADYAECRLYWTADMIKDVTQVWKAAADAGFYNGKCVHGGISSKSVARDVSVSRRRAREVVEELPIYVEEEYMLEKRSQGWDGSHNRILLE